MEVQIHGLPRDPSRLRDVLQDAVIVVLGAGAKGRVRAEGTRRIIDAMRRCGVRNLICQSTLGAGSSASMLNFKWRWFFRIPLRWAMADHERQEALVRASGQDWTIVRPGAFTDGPLTGEYQHGEQLTAPLSLEVSRKDVAHFLLGEASKPAYRSQAVALSY